MIYYAGLLYIAYNFHINGTEVMLSNIHPNHPTNNIPCILKEVNE